MLIYNADNISVDLNLEIVPAILTVTINDIDYEYNILGKPKNDKYPYNKQVQKWVDDNIETLKDIVWEWNMNRTDFPKIDVPLKLY